MKIQILGTGCTKCKQLAENTEAAARELGVTCELEKVTDIVEIMRYGVLATPALAIDGKVKLVGKVATAAELRALLSQAALASGHPNQGSEHK
jgi:small redox-active disulfide protein 2